MEDKRYLDGYRIFTCEESSPLFLEENFQRPIEGALKYFVWKSRGTPLGFGKDKESTEFIENIVKNKFTLLFPQLDGIPNADNKVNVHNMRGITFFKNFEEIKNEHSKLINYHIETKKKLLHERYGKIAPLVYKPFILKWYDKTSRKYTIDFTDYVLKNKLEFMIWAFCDWGTYIYTYTIFRDVIDNIEKLASSLNIEINKVENVSKMPNY